MTECNDVSHAPEETVEKQTGRYYIKAFLLALFIAIALAWGMTSWNSSSSTEETQNVHIEDWAANRIDPFDSAVPTPVYVRTMLMNAVYTAIPTICCCLYLLYVKKKKKLSTVFYFNPVEPVPYQKNAFTFFRRFAAIFASSIGISIVVKLMCVRLGVEEDDQAVVSLIAHVSDKNCLFYLVTLGATCIFAPICEEIMIRLVLTRAFAYRLPIPHAICLCALCFALLHGSISAAVPLFVIGCFLQKTCDEYGLWAAMAQHSMLNGGQLILLFLSIDN